jgi:hypothetical protein
MADNSYDLAYLADLLYFKMNLLQAEIAMNGMIAENKQREALGQSMAYVENDFASLIGQYSIHHNAFPVRRG